MGTLLNVIAPVFIVMGFGYVAAWREYLSKAAIDALMRFAQNIAVPCLLFLAISRIDLAADFNAPLLLSFYIGAFSGFTLGFLGARHLFKRSLPDSIAIGFCALFSNTVLLGLPITERAYGANALSGNFAIVSIHALVIYIFGTTLMEIVRSRQNGKTSALLPKITTALFHNPLLVGVLLGFVVNITNFPTPAVVLSALETIATAALPTALFALGGVLLRYRPEGDMKVIAWVTGISLIVHPLITYLLGTQVFALDQSHLRSAVLTAAMAPGVNTYLFANMYGTARRVAAASVLIATALSIITVWVWLAILP